MNFKDRHEMLLDCIYIFQFTLRTSGKSEDIWFESDEALINSSYDILSTPQGILSSWLENQITFIKGKIFEIINIMMLKYS